MKGLYLATDLMTGGSVRNDIESLSALNNEVQYKVVRPSDYKDMMFPLRVFSFYLGDVLQKKLVSMGKDENIMRRLAWDRCAPRKGMPRGLPLVDVYEDGGIYLGVPWHTLEIGDRQLDDKKGELTLRFPMNWIFGTSPPELTVLFSHKDAKNFYEGMKHDLSEYIRFGKCRQVGVDEEGRSRSIRCEGIATYGFRDPSPIHFNLMYPEPESTGHKIDGAEKQWEAMAKLKSLDAYKDMIREGFTDLHLAAERDFEHVAQHLIRAGDDIDAIYGKSTPLECAAHCNSCDVARVLLNEGAEIERISRDGYTPLLHSALTSIKGDPDNAATARLLLERDANVLAKTSSGLTVIHLASFYDLYLDRLRLFLDAFEEMGKFKADGVDAQDDQGRTALHIACDLEMAKECVKLLLDHGASKCIKNNIGQLPIDVADRPVDPELFSLLSP